MSKDRNAVVVKSASNMSLTAAAALTTAPGAASGSSSEENDYGFQVRKALIELNRVNELKGISKRLLN